LEEADIDEFYGDLSTLTRQIPKHNVTLIGGDFDAQLGRNDGVKHSFHTETNRSGEWLKDFLIENKFVCLNGATRSMHERNRQLRIQTVQMLRLILFL